MTPPKRLGLVMVLAGLANASAGRCESQPLLDGVGDHLDLRWSRQLSDLPQAIDGAKATAQTAQNGQPPQNPGPRWALDVSIDETQKQGASRDASLTWGFGRSLHEAGPRIRLVAGRSLYRYASDETRTTFVSGRSDQIEVLAGFTGLWRRSSLTVLAGVAQARSVESGRASELASAKAVASVFASPTDSTRLFSSISYTDASRYTQCLLKWGQAIGGGIQGGPELKADWRGGSIFEGRAVAKRVGVHLSSIPGWGGWWSVSLGHLEDQQLGEGAYLGLGFYGTD